jgi:hypothetical protein
MHWIIVASSPKQSDGTSNFQLWGVPVIVGIAFYILGAITTVYIKRPKLGVVGGGSGGGGGSTDYQVNHTTIRNMPGRVGIKIGQTVLFGFRVNRQHWFGLPVMREPATGCMASLCDDMGNHIAPLWWRDPGNVDKRPITIDLDSGQQADLFLFAQRNDDLPNYYPYEQGPSGDPIVPAVKLNGTRRFIVRLRYSDGQKKRDFKYTASTDYRYGRVNIRGKWRG